MTRMNSRPVTITQVYPQDTAPTDTREGVLWVDTSVSPPDTKVYDAASGTWEPVATSHIYVQDTAPSSPANGEIWVDTSVTPPDSAVYDGTNAVWVNQVDQPDLDNHAATASAHHARPTPGNALSEDANGNFDVVESSVGEGWHLVDTVTLSFGATWTNYTISGSYDAYRLNIRNISWNYSSGDYLRMRANGNSNTVHHYTDQSGSAVTGSSRMLVMRTNQGITRDLEIRIDGTWNDACGVSFDHLTPGYGYSSQHGGFEGTSPLDSVSFYADSGTFDATMEVFGR